MQVFVLFKYSVYVTGLYKSENTSLTISNLKFEHIKYEHVLTYENRFDTDLTKIQISSPFML